ncbi:hypothetical protein EDC01DRAFT_613845 [Geopyxis carbonaria]|nr:hypothetical protein EDC01DRAFT_613845 [Geopyxis carbonaria]
MVSAGLGKAIASIRPSLLDRRNTSTFNLTILDWRFKTHYDPDYHHEEDWEANREDYRWTQRSACDFFNALNPNSVTSLDLDFEVRYNRQQQGDLGNGTTAIRQSKSLKSFRLSHLRTSDAKLQNMFRQMAAAGFQPISLRLEDIYNESETSVSRDRWSFPRGMFDKLEDLQLSRFSGMFDLLIGVLRREEVTPFTNGGTSNRLAIPQPLKSLKLEYNDRHVRESPAEAFILNTIPALSSTLTFLKLVDTDYDFHLAHTNVAPRRRTHYDAIYHHTESPLESLVNLRVLVLKGDISSFLIGRRFPQIINAIEGTLEALDMCVSLIELSANDPTVFSGCRRLETLILREWSWDTPSSPPSPYGIPATPIASAPAGMNFPGSPFYPPIKRLTVEVIKRNLIEGNAVSVGSSTNRVRKMVLRDLGIAGGLLEVAGEEHWGELKEWAKKHGTRFWWHAAEMPRI